MIRHRKTRMRKSVWIGVLFIPVLGAGCSFHEAVIDGFFGGISDTVAAIVSGAALDAVGASNS